MIPNKDKQHIQGSIPGRSTRMTFDPNAVEHILSILTDMYSDTELAVIRELSTNARDSHVEAGNDAPIEVVTPGPLSPYLTITDYGVGLSVDELHDLYSKYGASTKRGTNDATGMLGIGSKSPLTYTSQFTLTAIQDGVAATVSISRDEDGVGNLTVVDTAQTSARNGVSIQIPAKAGNAFERKAKQFFSYWQPGTVLLNGDEPSKLNGLKITDSIMLVRNEDGWRYGAAESIVVMGNVPYPAGDELTSHALRLPYNCSVVAHVPIGAVDFAPSREALQFTSRTKKAIAEIAAQIRPAIAKAVEREVQVAPSLPEAIKLAATYSELHSLADGFTWRGVVVPDCPLEKQDGETLLLVDKTPGRFKHASQKTMRIRLQHLPDAIFVKDYDELSFTPTHKKKFLQWLDKQDNSDLHNLRNSIWTNSKLPTNMLFPHQIVSWNTIKAEKLDYGRTKTGPTGRIQGSFDLVLGDNAPVGTSQWPTGVPGSQIDQTLPVYYHHGNQGSVSTLLGGLKTAEDKFTIVCLSANRLAKFQRDYPHIKELGVRVKEIFETELKKLTEAQKRHLWIADAANESDFAVLKSYRDQIHDPRIRDGIDALSTDIQDFLQLRRKFSRFYYNSDDDYTNPFDDYPLYDLYVARSSPDIVIRYLNFEYNYQNENPN